MEKRVVFRSAWLPDLLVAPQLAITIIFFFLPAGQTLAFIRLFVNLPPAETGAVAVLDPAVYTLEVAV